jgi:glycosyltransferase involved in cell wall biosynthesis
LSRLLHIIRFLKKTKPMIVQSAHFYANLYVVAAARCLGLREVGAIRSNGRQDVIETGKIFGRMSLCIPRTLAGNSQLVLANLVEIGRSRPGLHYLPNVVDTEQFSPRPDHLPENEFRLVMAGRLGAPKRFDVFLHLLAALQREGRTNTSGTIIGDGPLREQLQALAFELGLKEEQACFCNAVADVERIYRQANVYVHLSDWEGMPNAVLEAMACGLPVIASPVGGIPELVQEGQTGYLVDLKDEAGLLGRVQLLMDDEDKRKDLGRAGRAYVEQAHSLQKLPAILDEFYEAILR